MKTREHDADETPPGLTVAEAVKELVINQISAKKTDCVLERVAKRLEVRSRDMEKARAFTDEERTQRRCMAVIYAEISNMIRAAVVERRNDFEI